MNPILLQVVNNGAILLIAVLILSLPQRGFIWKFIRVRLSFGKLLMVKIRAINRDHFKVGHIVERWLIFKFDKNSQKRIAIDDSSPFYRCLGCTWVDIDEGKNAVVQPDYSVVSGFDAVKYSDLLKRALYKPQINDDIMNFRIIMIMVGVGILATGVVIFIVYNMYNQIGILQQAVAGLQKGTVVGSPTL